MSFQTEMKKILLETRIVTPLESDKELGCFVFMFQCIVRGRNVNIGQLDQKITKQSIKEVQILLTPCSKKQGERKLELLKENETELQVLENS